MKKFLLSLLFALLIPFGAVAQEAYAVYENGTLTFYYDNQKSSRSGTKYELNTGDNDPGWYTDHRQDITKAVFDSSFANARPTSTYKWFAVDYYETSALTGIEGIEYLNTSEVTDMSYMFFRCINLASLDLRSFDTSEVTNMTYMFHFSIGLTSLDLSSFDTSCVTDMSYMFGSCSNLTSLDLSNFDTSNVTTMNCMFVSCSGLTSLDLRSFDTSEVTNMSYMFRDCSSLTSLDLSSFNTSSVTDMSRMFLGCSNLTSLDLSNFDTSNVTTMYLMFYGCSNLASLDLSTFDTSSVTNMQEMFRDCSSLTSLDLLSFDTSSVTNMREMFLRCNGLISLDLSSFDTSNVTDMRTMFFGCSNLTTIYCGDEWNTDKVTSSSNIFSNCYNLVGGAGTVYSSGHTSIAYAHVDGGPNNPGYLTMKSSSQAYAVYENGTLTFYYDNLKISRSGTAYELNTGYNDPGWYTDHRQDITKAVFDPSFANARPTSTYKWFAVSSNETSALTSVEDIENLNTSSVTNMGYMFLDCSNLTSLDLRSFDTSSVTSMYLMFYGCSNLTSLDLSNFNTSNVTDMSLMFCGCSNLTSLDMSSFNTGSVTDMHYMFEYCSSLTSLDLSSFDTSSVTDMSSMFYGCSNLTSLDLSSFDTSNVTGIDMNSMFSNCSSLTSLDLGSFNTSRVTSMGWMFFGCSSLTTLDLSSFDTSSVTHMERMFYGCSSLTTIYCGDDWNTDKVTSSSETFRNYTNLVGGAGTAYNSNYTDKTYAHVDGGPNNPGYLTLKVTDVSQIDNVIYVKEMEKRNGQQVTLSLMMKNTVPIRGFQFDLYLPEGAMVVKSDKGRIQGALSAGRLPEEDEHNLTFSEQADGAIRFLCSSQYNETFTGNDGEIATLQIRLADDMADGDYAIVLKDVKLTETDINKFYETEKVVSKLTIISYIMGDISGDGKVDVSDYTGVANYIHNNPPAGFNAKAADVDENGKIDVSDYTGIANIIHTGSVYGYSNTNNAPRRSGEENQPDTDVSTIDNVIYISPFTVSAGTQTTLSFKMKNTVAIRGFQFDLYLPEGMTAVKSAMGRIQGALSAGRLPDEDEHDLTFSEQDDGAIRFLCSSQYNETFTGTDGELATLQVNVAAGMADGDYALLLREIKLTESDISKFYETELVKTTVTVGSSAGVDVVLDETDTEVPEATAGDVTILVKRTIKANEWSTICLPFDMTEAQTKAAFGNGVQLKEFTNYEVEYDTNDNVVGLTVNFDDTDLSEGFYGNYPYLIKVENDIDEFTVTSTINPDESDCYIEYDNGRTGNKRKVYGTFRGFYHAQTTVPNNCLFLSGNKFWYSTGQTKMKAFRAYFDFVDVLDNLENANARISMSFDDETTRIEDVNVNLNGNDNYYDLQGRRVVHPQKGLYIKNNKKVVVK